MPVTSDLEQPPSSPSAPAAGYPPPAAVPRGWTRLFSGSIDAFLHPPANQIPFLHGLRTLAVLLVINFHFSIHYTALHGSNSYASLPFVLNGWMGVDLFFVLSGFFIGGQLWKELWSEGSISISRFMLRRGMRIWPLYFFTFLCVLIFLPHYAASKAFGWSDVVFLTNYFNRGIVSGGWSLCTEEQFYIVAPILLYAFARNRSPRASLTMLWVLFAMPTVWRATLWMHRLGSLRVHSETLFDTRFYQQFDTHCDGLILGLILAHQWISRDRPKTTKSQALLIVAAGAALFVLLRHLQHEVLILCGLAVLFGSVVWAGLVARVVIFRSRIFYWLSRLSFGMYLNHHYLEPTVMTRLLPALHAFPAGSVADELLGTLFLVLGSALVAFATFCLVEHPFLNLRMKLMH